MGFNPQAFATAFLEGQAIDIKERQREGKDYFKRLFAPPVLSDHSIPENLNIINESVTEDFSKKVGALPAAIGGEEVSETEDFEVAI